MSGRVSAGSASKTDGRHQSSNAVSWNLWMQLQVKNYIFFSYTMHDLSVWGAMVHVWLICRHTRTHLRIPVYRRTSLLLDLRPGTYHVNNATPARTWPVHVPERSFPMSIQNDPSQSKLRWAECDSSPIWPEWSSIGIFLNDCVQLFRNPFSRVLDRIS